MQRNNKGFLLIEVLVTVAILAFGLIYISRAFINCLNAMSQVVDYTLATILAEKKFFQIEMESNLEANLKQKGIFADEPNFNFALDIGKIKDQNLYNVYLKLGWKEGRRTGSFDISGYLPVKE